MAAHLGRQRHLGRSPDVIDEATPMVELGLSSR